MTRRLLNAALGFIIGVITIPVAAVLYPFAFAWWMWNEADDEGAEQ